MVRPPPDIEKAADPRGSDEPRPSGDTLVSEPHHGKASNSDDAESSPSSHTAGSEPNSQGGLNFPRLKLSSTQVSCRSAREALWTLEHFERSPNNPRNWSRGRKWLTTLTVAMTGFVATCGSSIGVPGIHEAMQHFGYENEKIGVLVTSGYVLGMGAGPFIFAPISEVYGRQVAYLSSQTCLILFCMGTALSPTMTGLIFLRFFCGVFASVGPSLGVATCADLFDSRERGLPVSMYALGPMSGPVLGSMLGYWILYGGWRWVLWALTIMAGVNWVLLASLAQETYAPVIHKKLLYQVSHPQEDATSFLHRLSPMRHLHNLSWMTAMVSRDELASVFGKAFSRPPRLLFGNPLAFFVSVYHSYLYGIIYVFLVSIPLLYGSPPFSSAVVFSYHWPQYTLGFSYLGMAFGFGLAALLTGTQQDRLYKRLSKRFGTEGEPEYRLVLMQIGVITMPCGLFLFGWTAHSHTHWMGPMVGQAMISFGLMIAFSSSQHYLVDSFFPYSAAAIAGMTAMRSSMGCVLPVFARDLFRNLGWGWADTLLAGVAILAIPVPAVLLVYGKRLRNRFKFNG